MAWHWVSDKPLPKPMMTEYLQIDVSVEVKS